MLVGDLGVSPIMKTTFILMDKNSPTKETIELNLEMSEEMIEDIRKKICSKRYFELIGVVVS